MKIRNKINKSDLLFIIIITFIFSILLFYNSIPREHDLLFHMNRLVGIFEGIKDHQIPVRVYPNTNNGFGYGASLFYCDFFLYPFALLYGYLNVPLIISFKIMLACIFLLTSITTLYACRKIFKKDLTIYITSILYIFSNYHMMTTYTRMALGEIFTMAFMPLAFLAIYQILKEHKDSYLLLGISFSCILMSHLLSFSLCCFLFIIFIIYFLIINIKDIKIIKKAFFTTLKGTILAIILSAAFFFPMLEQIFTGTYFFEFPYFYDVLNPKYIFSFFTTNSVGVEFFSTISLGLPLLIIPIFSLFKKNKLNIFLFVINIILILIIYDILSISSLKYSMSLQFSFRLFIIVTPIASYLVGNVLDEFESRNLINILSIIILLVSIINIVKMTIDYKPYYLDGFVYYSNTSSVDELFDMSDSIKEDVIFNIKEISGGEYLPPTEFTDYLNDTKAIKKYINEYEWVDVILEPKDDYYNEILCYSKDYSHITFTYDSNESEQLLLPQTYYKGYQVYLIEEGWTKLDTYTLPHYYQVTFTTIPGLHNYICFYKGTTIQKVSEVCSALGIIFLFINQFLKRRKIKHDNSLNS